MHPFPVSMKRTNSRVAYYVWYVFGEFHLFLQTAIGDFEKDWKLLNLFAYGKFKDYSGK